jgi:hypothetical protein
MKADTVYRGEKCGGSRKLINGEKDAARKYGTGTGTLLNFWVTANILYRYRVNVWYGKTFSTLGQV